MAAMSAADGWTRRAIVGGGLALASAPAVAAMTTKTPAGRYRGAHSPVAETGGATAWRGIRYARALRFQAPSEVAGAEQMPANAFGPACPQMGARYTPQSEECLFLNVWAPAGRSGDPRPVMVYFHGGAYSTGSVTDPINDGAALAARGDVVVVTVNHRLNAFGYLYLPERFPDSGNAGQLDLIAALRWIRRNIADFGGDPGNVTVFGQSGGGAKIATLMAMPAAAGLFHKAITMSGQQVTASGPLNAARRAAVFQAKLGAGVDPAVAPAAMLVEALGAVDPVLSGGVYMGPVLDMTNLVRHPFWPDAPPQSRAIHMLLGNTHFETRAFYQPGSRQLSGLTFDNLAQRIAPEMRIDIEPSWVVARFRERYGQADAPELFHRIVTAARSWRGQVEEADARARQEGALSWVYRLDFGDAKHTDDIGLSFGTIPGATTPQARMSATVLAAFTRFARTGDPGWEPYGLERRATMVFDTDSRVESDPRGWERQLFGRVPYIQPGS